MKIAMRSVSAFCFAAAIAGCAGGASFAPKDAVLGPDYAEAVFELGVADTVSLGSATTQEYRISDTDQWEEGRLVKIFTWAHKSPKVLLLGADKRVYVFARMKRIYGAPGITSSGDNWCMNGSAFTPRPNTRYRIQQTGSAYGACTLTIIDAAAGEEPADVEQVLFPPPAETS